MKRKQLIAVAGLLVCSMLAGCGSGGGESSQGSDRTGQQSGASGDASDSGSGGNSGDSSDNAGGNAGNNDSSAGSSGEEITFPLDETWTVEAFAFSNTGQELDKTLTMQKLEERTNIHWDLTTVSQAELDEKRNLSFNGGDYYDVYIKSGISSVDTYKYAAQGIIIPLNDLINQYMPNLKKKLDEQDVWGNITSADGNIYALPELDGPGLSAPGVFINTVWLDKVGKKMPETKEEFYDVLCAFRDGDPNGNGEQDEYPIYCPNGAVSMLMPIFGIAMDWNTMSMYDHDTGSITYVPTSQEYKDFLEFMAKAYKEKLVNQDCYSATWDDINAIGATQDALGVIPTWGVYQHVGTERDEEYDAILPFERAHSIPAGKGVQYGGLVITDKCEHPELICAWADYLYTEEGATLGMMGVEGETYTLDENGKYHWIEDGKWGTDQNTIRNSALMVGWYPAPLGASVLYSEGMDNPEELFLLQQRKRLLEYAADEYPSLSWSEEELEEKADLVTSINSYVDQYQALVVTGEADLESTWDEYLANLSSMRLERLQEIDKAAYDRWLSERQ